jgi:NAD(P)-dependent dehydrogenase (short-subunit alcohol dehydrogenase family)
MTVSELNGQVAIVTGGASGIGAATVRQLVAAGAYVAIFDREFAAAETLARTLNGAGESAWPFAIDLADAAAIPASVDSVLAHFGRIDILVNCAGITGPQTALLDFDADAWDRVYAVNLKAPLLLMQRVGRHMIARGGGGRIVNVSSSSGFRALPSAPAYGSSKAALSHLTATAAGEFGPHNINVNAVAPGLTATPLLVDALGDKIDDSLRSGPLANMLQRISQPDDIAAVIVFLCLPASRQITAQTVHVSAGAIV